MKFSKLIITVFVASLSAVMLTGCFGGEQDVLTQSVISDSNQGNVSVEGSTPEHGVDGEFFDPEALNGNYDDVDSQRASMFIIFDEEAACYDVLIAWSDSDSKSTQWSMVAYDTGDSMTLEYQNGACNTVTYEDEENATITNIYADKEGTLKVEDDGTIVWTDDEGEEHHFKKQSE